MQQHGLLYTSACTWFRDLQVGFPKFLIKFFSVLSHKVYSFVIGSFFSESNYSMNTVGILHFLSFLGVVEGWFINTEGPANRLVLRLLWDGQTLPLCR